ncbi:unnamed protein product [marine sediment metagenome]|uniref:Uncharacterized protein n=1 Tax=marine sediment metagenome TaxID=412755 RepID=X1I9S9_9ZZZZ
MSYVTLVVDEDYLKPIGELADSADEGIIQEDLDAAENEAMQVTKGKIGWMYDISTWEATTPPQIEYVNKLLASAVALEYYLSRDTDIAVGTQYEPEKLWEQGMAYLEQIRKGDMELMDSSDAHIPRLKLSPRQGPRSVSSRATFYTDSKYKTSFGKLPRFSAQKTFEDT